MKTKDNVITEGFSGKHRQIVFRQLNGETIASKRPRRKKEATAAQLNVRAIFKEAAAYAKAVMTDAVKKLVYLAKAKPGLSGFNLALADYFKLPEIGDIDSSGYNGLVGGIIKIVAKDDFKVASVLVRIEKADGTLVEDGPATDSGDGIHWTYGSAIAAGNINGNKVIVTATDMPGNSIVKSKTI